MESFLSSAFRRLKIGCCMNNGRYKIEKIVGCKTIDYLVEDEEFIFISPVLDCSPT